MTKNRIFDTFKPSASQIAFVDRGKGITAPNLQVAIEEIKETLDKIDDHLHRGQGENSVQVGPGSVANADSSISLGHGASSNANNGIAIGTNASNNAGNQAIAIGSNAQANSENAVAIGSGASTQGSNAVAIGPGAVAETNNTIVLGTTEHSVIIPGNLDVLGWIKGSVSWIGPSDNVIAEIPTPIEAEAESPLGTARAVKTLTLKNPGKYRIKGVLYIEHGSNASLSIWEDEELIANPIYTTSQTSFSVDFDREIGMNTTLTLTLNVLPSPGSDLPARGGVSQIRICGAPTDIGSGVVAW